MKFTQTLAPIASLALVVSGASTVTEGYNQPAKGYGNSVSFSQEGLQKVIDAKSNGPNGDHKAALKSVKDFFKRNPTLIKSVFTVVNQPKHKKAKDEIIQAVKYVKKQGGKVDIPALKVKAVDFIYKHPEIQALGQQIAKQVIQDHPSLVEDFQTQIFKLAKKNPGAFKKIRKQMIEFSDSHNDTYEKVFEMVLKTAALDPKFSAKVAKGALKINQVICEGSSSEGCDCGEEYGNGQVDTPDTVYQRPQSIKA